MIILISGWKMVGFATLMFSSALSGIDKQYYEAAAAGLFMIVFGILALILQKISTKVAFYDN